jgi:uncharacterized delta-60 repeat protein
MKIQLLISTFALGIISFTSEAQIAGTLYPDFGQDGRYIEDFGFQDNIETVALQDDGKVVAAGTALSQAFAGQLLVLRTNADGTADTGFGDNGHVIITDYTESYAYKILIQEDGKIVVCGAAANAQYVFSMLFFRLNTDGTIDTTFGDNGFRTTDFYSGDEFCYGATLVAGDKIVGVGSAALPNFAVVPVIMRLTADGDIDTSFGIDGANLSPASSTDNTFYDVKEDSQGNLLACGYYGNGITNEGQIDNDVLLVRFADIGALDIGFGDFGSVVIPAGTYIDAAYALVLDNSENIYLAGYTTLPDFSFDAIIIGLNPDGDLRTDFADNGIYSFDLNVQDVFNDIAFYDNNLFACGTSGGFFFDDRDFLLASITTESGENNPMFSNGYALTSIMTAFDDANAMVIDPIEESVFLAGKGNNGNNNDAAITKHLALDIESVSELENNSKLSIYPNPSVDGIIQLSTDNGPIEHVTIYDAQGKICYEFQGNSTAKMQLHLPELKTGVYSISVQTSRGITLTERLLIL